MYVKTSNNTVDEFPYTIRKLRKDNFNVSFPQEISEETLSSFGVFSIARGEFPENILHTETAVHASVPELVDGVWTLPWVVRDKTQDEIASEAKAARYERDELLTLCDWTQLPDSPLDSTTKASWATYRTALRDISTQAGFPTNITWPTAP